MFQAIAIHHAAPEHVDDFAQHMRNVVAATEGAPGLLAFDCWRDTAIEGRLLAVSRWESEQAFRDALPRIGSLRHRRRPEWSVADDELLTSTPLG